MPREGELLQPIGMFVASPHRSKFPKEADKGGDQAVPVRPDGTFKVSLPRGPYVDSALVTVVAGVSNHTLFMGLVALNTPVEIVVHGANSKDLRPLQGTIELRNGSASLADLLLLQVRDNEPITFQRRLSGSVIDIEMPVCKRLFADVEGPVLLLLDDEHGLHVQMSFDSMSHLVKSLSDRIIVDLQQTQLVVPDLNGSPVEFVEVAASCNDRMRKRHPVVGGEAQLLTTAGLLAVHGIAESAGIRGWTRLPAGPGRVVAQWAYVSPGDYAQELTVLDSLGRPLPGVSASLRLMRPKSKEVAPGMFSWSGNAGEDGVVRAIGLHEGEYVVELRHNQHVTKRVSVEVPTSGLKATLQPGATLAWHVQSASVASIPGKLTIIHRAAGDELWKVTLVGPETGTGDYTQAGVPPGVSEFVLVAGDQLASGSIEIPPGVESVPVAVRLQAPECWTIRVESAGGPKQGLRVEVSGNVEGRVAILTRLTDVNGECRFPPLPLSGCVARALSADDNILGETLLVAGALIRVP